MPLGDGVYEAHGDFSDINADPVSWDCIDYARVARVTPIPCGVLFEGASLDSAERNMGK